MFNGEQLRLLRERGGMTHSDLARELYKHYDLEISRNTLINYEGGDTDPGVGRASIIARFFKVKLDSLTKQND